MKDRVGASSFVITIKDRLDALSSSPPNHTIFKIHELLRRENVMAYEPEMLAIGPYHRGKERLQAMEVWKLRSLKSTLEQQGDVDATEYVEAMKRLEGRARECYSESVNICQNADEFAEMLLLDGCFIIQLLLSMIGCHEYDTIMSNHRFFQKKWVMVSICRDMLLLENQIPLFVLEELFYLTKLSIDGTHFHVIAQDFAGTALTRFSGIPKPPVNTSLSNVNDVEHLLGLLHYMFHPPVNNLEAHDSDTRKLRTKSSIKLAEWLRSLSCGMLDDDIVDELNSESIPSATKLHDAGVTLKIKNVENKYPFEITFSNGVMEVPILNIYDCTEAAYRNLIAYEQYCQGNLKCCFAHHASFMDCLIDSPEDVALLRGCGIIGNYIGDDEAVSTMFNKLCKHITFSVVSKHGQIFDKVHAYCGKRRHRWMAKLRRDYFNNPWSFISFLAALFLLLLTVTQTVFSALGT